ncbi:hypothetical protein G4B88_020586 [Cannabis sativa]|uniref:Uncharacterized protein n=1 Tax=Cannabis sativa TaxID=3483 RepID=A0A7J6E0P6_CANSA|nr:hypothetical protein G4B88_020586 [Cannabis sativa]
MMLRLWKWYQNCLAFHPVKTQVISSGFLWGAGDVAAQYITHTSAKRRLKISDAEADFKVNWKRVAITSSFGFGFVGPVGHFWFVFPIFSLGVRRLGQVFKVEASSTAKVIAVCGH